MSPLVMLISTMALICLTSCVPKFEYTFYNHTSKSLVLFVRDSAFPIRKDDAISLGNLARNVRISDGETNWEYDLSQMPMIPRDYWGWEFSGHQIRCQIESRGTVYLLRTDESMPINVDPLHPPALFAKPLG